VKTLPFHFDCFDVVASVAVISLKLWIGANAWDGLNQPHRFAAAEAFDRMSRFVFGLFSVSHAGNELVARNAVSWRLILGCDQIRLNVKHAAVLRDPGFAHGIGQFAVIQAVAPSVGIEVSPSPQADFCLLLCQ
jgi:hypothetical protein